MLFVGLVLVSELEKKGNGKKEVVVKSHQGWKQWQNRLRWRQKKECSKVLSWLLWRRKEFYFERVTEKRVMGLLLLIIGDFGANLILIFV